MAKTKHRLSESERAERRAQDRERLQRAAEQLLSSDGWQRWVRARASNGLARYSLTNQLLVALQSDGRATFVAGFKRWLELGYCVAAGSQAIRIMAPMPVKARDRATGEETDETITLFKSVPVFFQEQVEPLPDREPTPLAPPSEPLSGDSHARLLPRLVRFCESLGYSVSFEAIEGPAGGWCDRRARRIVVDCGVALNSSVIWPSSWNAWNGSITAEPKGVARRFRARHRRTRRLWGTSVPLRRPCPGRGRSSRARWGRKRAKRTSTASSRAPRSCPERLYRVILSP